MTILDYLMPAWDAHRAEDRVIDAPPGVVFAAAITADFLDAVRLDPIVRSLFAIRSAAERLAAFLRRTSFAEPPPPATLRLIDLPAHGEWVRLGESSLELAFGVVGRFWAGETRWATMDAKSFAAFADPGFAKIACHLRVIPLEDGRSRLVYVARTLATDDAARRAFHRYWRVVSPFVGIVMRATLGVVARDVAARTRGPAAQDRSPGGGARALPAKWAPERREVVRREVGQESRQGPLLKV